MPNSPVKLADVGQALYTHLTTASTFDTLIGGRLFNAHAPARTDLAYAVFVFIDTTQMITFEADGYESRVQVSMYASKEGGPGAVFTLRDALVDRLNGESWTVTDHEQMDSLLDVERGPFRDDNRWRYDVDVFLRGFRT